MPHNAIVRTERHSPPLAVAFVGLFDRRSPDEPLSVLPTEGWVAIVVQHMHGVFRKEDTIAFLDSGRPNEFAVLLEDVTDEEGVRRALTRFLIEFEPVPITKATANGISVRCGAAVSVPPGPLIDRLLIQTEVAYRRALAAPGAALTRFESTYVLFDPVLHRVDWARLIRGSGESSGTLRNLA